MHSFHHLNSRREFDELKRMLGEAISRPAGSSRTNNGFGKKKRA